MKHLLSVSLKRLTGACEINKKRPKRDFPPGLVAVNQPGTPLCRLLSDKGIASGVPKAQTPQIGGLAGNGLPEGRTINKVVYKKQADGVRGVKRC